LSKNAQTAKPPPKGKAAPGPKTKVIPGERAAKLAKDARPHKDKIRELYLVALAREPTPAEAELLLAHVNRNQANVRAAYEDILWVLINTEDFLFNR
jgi:hypothetical protein